MSDILDYHAQHVLRRIIDELPYNQQEQLKNIHLCGRKIIRQPGHVSAVYVMRNSDGGSKFFGQSHCQNPFACPTCAARIMEKYRSMIASALDMLKDDHFAFMATFTVPHLKFMSCREVTDILYDTWKYFRMKMKPNPKKNWVHPYYAFNQEVPIEYWVRICEYTYGEENGWHPHFHVLYWTKRGYEDKILEWQDKLNEFWIEQAKRVALKYWKANKLHEGQDLEKLADRLFCFAVDEYTKRNPALKFSTDENGKIRESKSSSYLTGWSCDQEITGNIRKEASHENHYTPYQILLKAEHDLHWRNIYVDFCLSVTRKPVHHRMNFSKNGFVKKIEAYRKEHGYQSVVIQKKRTWKVVAYFYEDEWSRLYDLNKFAPVLSNILYLAGKDTDLMHEYLESLEFERRRIEPTLKEDMDRIMREQCEHIESIFNDVAS